MMPQMPLPKTSGGVPLGFQMISNRVLAGVQSLGGCRKQYMLMHPHPFWIATGEQSRPRRRTNWRSHHKARELAPFLGDAVDVGRLDGLGPKATEVPIALVIREDDDKIRLGRAQLAD